MPASVPSIARARCVFANRRTDEGAEQYDDSDDERPGEPEAPGQKRIVRFEIDRQHDEEDDDEHVRDARPVRQRRYIVSAFTPRESPSHPGVEQIADGKRDSQSG